MSERDETHYEVRVAQPCPVAWDEMQGDNRVRRCALCSCNVFNFAEMSRDEAETVLREHEGRLCARMFVRSDGTMMTRDCPQPQKPRGPKALWAVWRRKPEPSPRVPSWMLPAPILLTGIVARPMPSEGTSPPQLQSNAPTAIAEELRHERTSAEKGNDPA